MVRILVEGYVNFYWVKNIIILIVEVFGLII